MPQSPPLTPADQLALDRTRLANERTLLAYLRTALGLIALGAAALKVFHEPLMQILGAASVAAGILVVCIGAWRYRVLCRRLRVSTSQQSIGTTEIPQRHRGTEQK